MRKKGMERLSEIQKGEVLVQKHHYLKTLGSEIKNKGSLKVEEAIL